MFREVWRRASSPASVWCVSVSSLRPCVCSVFRDVWSGRGDAPRRLRQSGVSVCLHSDPLCVQCSVTCGAGVETRLVACVSLEQLETQVAAVTASTQCDVAVKPSGEKSCNLHSCHRGYNIASISSNRVVGTAHWRVGSWGQVRTRALNLTLQHVR